MNISHRILASAGALTFVFTMAKQCNLDNPDNGEGLCTVAARDTLTLTTKCVDQHGNNNGYGKVYDIPSDLYPNCQVGRIWEDCKWSKP